MPRVAAAQMSAIPMDVEASLGAWGPSRSRPSTRERSSSSFPSCSSRGIPATRLRPDRNRSPRLEHFGDDERLDLLGSEGGGQPLAVETDVVLGLDGHGTVDLPETLLQS